MLMNCSLAERALVGNRGRSIFLAQNQQQLRLKILARSSRLGRHAGVRKKERKKEKGEKEREKEREKECVREKRGGNRQKQSRRTRDEPHRATRKGQQREILVNSELVKRTCREKNMRTGMVCLVPRRHVSAAAATDLGWGIEQAKRPER